MGLGAERHDLMSQETHAAQWISFRQPVLRTARERLGERFEWTHEANPGQVWAEDEYYGWIFEKSVPGLPAAAAKQKMSPLEYMRRFGAFLVNSDTYNGHLE